MRMRVNLMVRVGVMVMGRSGRPGWGLYIRIRVSIGLRVRVMVRGGRVDLGKSLGPGGAVCPGEGVLAVEDLVHGGHGRPQRLQVRVGG